MLLRSEHVVIRSSLLTILDAAKLRFRSKTSFSHQYTLHIFLQRVADRGHAERWITFESITHYCSSRLQQDVVKFVQLTSVNICS